MPFISNWRELSPKRKRVGQGQILWDSGLGPLTPGIELFPLYQVVLPFALEKDYINQSDDLLSMISFLGGSMCLGRIQLLITMALNHRDIYYLLIKNSQIRGSRGGSGVHRCQGIRPGISVILLPFPHGHKMLTVALSCPSSHTGFPSRR